MDKEESAEGGQVDEDKECSSGNTSLSGSLNLSASGADSFRRQIMRPPNKKKYEEEMEEVMTQIKAKEAEMASLGSTNPEASALKLRDIRSEKEASIIKRKKIDSDLQQQNKDITKMMGQLSKIESNLHYKNEARIDEVIRKMEFQLQKQNFRVSEERRIVAEIDKLKRSKKVLVEYFAQKKEIDKLREGQRRMRGEREHYYRAVTSLNRKEEELKRSTEDKKIRAEEIKKELATLHERRRVLYADFKQAEVDYNRHQNERRHRLRKESFKKREEERRAKEESRQKELFEYERQREPFEDEKNLCNTLISYLQRYVQERDYDSTLPSPREETASTTFGSGSSLGPADSLDDGKLVLLKKSEEAELDYSVANKPRRRSKKDRRKLSVTKPLAHTPQIIAQFSSLNLSAPSNLSEVTASIEQLQARKRYYEQQAMSCARPMLGSLAGSFSSSGSGSLDSPLRERASTWSYVEVPPAIAENQAPSDAGTSAESGFHDMSRQASKTESSESAAEGAQTSDMVLEELMKQTTAENSPEFGETETTSRSSSDTITPEEQLVEDAEQTQPVDKSSAVDCAPENAQTQTSQGNGGNELRNTTTSSHGGASLQGGRKSDHGRGRNRRHLSGGCIRGATEPNPKIVNYDTDFPPVTLARSATVGNDGRHIQQPSDKTRHCDRRNTTDRNSRHSNTPTIVVKGDCDSDNQNSNTNQDPWTVKDVKPPNTDSDAASINSEPSQPIENPSETAFKEHSTTSKLLSEKSEHCSPSNRDSKKLELSLSGLHIRESQSKTELGSTESLDEAYAGDISDSDQVTHL